MREYSERRSFVVLIGVDRENRFASLQTSSDDEIPSIYLRDSRVQRMLKGFRQEPLDSFLAMAITVSEGRVVRVGSLVQGRSTRFQLTEAGRNAVVDALSS